MSLPKPYYEDSAVTLYHGDCRQIVPFLGKFDLLLTDPPYGIGRVWKGGFKSSGWAKAATQKDVRNEWDADAPTPEVFDSILAAADVACIWGGNYFWLPPSRGWLIWEKPERNFTLAEAEMAWTNKDMVVRVWNGPRSEPERQHPTQKPLKLMTWCIERMGGNSIDTILDPFAGSGTTGRAAKDLGKTAVLIEREEKYCEIIARRMQQEVLAL